MVGALLYLGVCGTALAFVWYYMSIKKFGTAVTSIFNNLVPVFGVAISVLLLGEPLLASMLIGGAVAIAGVMMVSRPEPQGQAARRAVSAALAVQHHHVVEVLAQDRVVHHAHRNLEHLAARLRALRVRRRAALVQRADALSSGMMPTYSCAPPAAADAATPFHRCRNARKTSA